MRPNATQFAEAAASAADRAKEKPLRGAPSYCRSSKAEQLGVVGSALLG